MSTGINTCQQRFYGLSANAPKYSNEQSEPYSKTIVITSVGSENQVNNVNTQQQL